MYFKTIISVALPVVMVLSCGESNQEETTNLPVSDNGTAVTNQLSLSDTSPSKPAGTVNVQPVTTPANTSLSGKLNPAHGQPGHRCEIPVGSPLDGPAPANTTANTTPQTVTINPSTTNQTQTVSIPAPQNASAPVANKNQKLNPAHGQPGHRCDIAVGAPLDSKPAVKTEVNTVNPTDAKNPLQYYQPPPKVNVEEKKPNNLPKKDSASN